MSDVLELTQSDVQGVRPPLWMVKVATTAAIGALIVAEVSVGPTLDPMLFSRAVIGSAAYLATGLEITAMGLALTVWLAPRTSLATLALVATVLPTDGVSRPVAWPILGVASLLTLVWLLLSERRRDDAPAGESGVPRAGWEDNWARRGLWLGTAALVASVIVLVGSLVWHTWDVADTRAFEARATATTATALRPEYDDWVFDIGGREVTMYPPDVDIASGMVLGVLIDPEDPERIVFVAEPEDPSWLVGVAGLTPALAGWGLGAVGMRRRQDALVSRGGPVRQARMRVARKGYALLPPGATFGPSLLVKEVALAYGGPNGPRRVEGTDAGMDVRDVEAKDEPPLPSDPAELAAWADQVQDELAREQAEMDAAEDGPVLLGDVDVTVVGQLVEGEPVALRLEDGRVYLGVLAVPWRKPLPAEIPRHAGDYLPSADTPVRTPGENDSGWSDTLSLALAWLRTQGRHLRWVAVPLALAGAWLAVWVVSWGDVEWIRTAFAALFVVWMPVRVSDWIGGGGVCRDRSGFRMLGAWFDDVIVSSRVVTVTAGQHSVAVRLQEPDDALSLGPDGFHEDGHPDPEGAAALVREWIRDADSRGRGGLRPTPGLLGAILIVLTWAAVAAAHLLG